MKMKKILYSILTTTLLLSSCRGEDPIIKPSDKEVGGEDSGPVAGFFLLNEGNFGSNKCSLDYYDYSTGVYSKNIFPSRNPEIVKELGDVGNDLKIYGSKLYAVINNSNIIEVMDVRTAKHLATIPLPQGRYITFSEGYGYVSSYAGTVDESTKYQKGYVARIDTTRLVVVDSCTVGYQPEELAVVGEKLYVANSGGYCAPDYDATVSIIDTRSFKVKSEIETEINLHRLKKDNDGNLWVTSRGDYYSVPSKLIYINTTTDLVEKVFDEIPCSDIAIFGDSLFVQSSQWIYETMSMANTYSIVDIKGKCLLSDKIITDGSNSEISSPYGIFVNPTTGEFFIPDAGDYVNPGSLHCYSADGKRKWKVTTGDIPGHIAFTRVHLQ